MVEAFFLPINAREKIGNLLLEGKNNTHGGTTNGSLILSVSCLIQSTMCTNALKPWYDPVERQCLKSMEASKLPKQEDTRINKHRDCGISLDRGQYLKFVVAENC